MKRDFIILIIILAMALLYENSTNSSKIENKHKTQEIENTRIVADQDEITTEPIIEKVQEDTIPKVEEPKERFSKTKAFIQKKRAEWK
jgi:uncharacterized membrane protein